MIGPTHRARYAYANGVLLLHRPIGFLRGRTPASYSRGAAFFFAANESPCLNHISVVVKGYQGKLHEISL